MKKITFIVLASMLNVLSTEALATETAPTPPSAAITGPTALPPPAEQAAVAASDKQGPVTGTFDVTNNYVFRGISNSHNNPAVQGGFTYTFDPTGIYLNVWGSNVDFLDPRGSQATVEVDAIAGISNDVGEDFNYNINIDRYNYPRASAANYYELITALTYKIFTATIGYSTNVYGVHKKGTYYNGALNYDLDPKYALHFNNVSVMGSVGHYRLPKSAGLLSYTDYMLGIKKTQGQYTFMLQWTGTNGQSHQPPIDGNFVVATVQVDF